MMTLMNDISRCNGELDRSECTDCLRRIAPRPEFSWMIKPSVDTPCVNQILDNKKAAISSDSLTNCCDNSNSNETHLF